MSLNALWHTIQAGIASFGAWLAAYLGGLDGLVYALPSTNAASAQQSAFGASHARFSSSPWLVSRT